MGREIWTVGHSNRDLGTFVGLLAGAGIGGVADVRRFPGSRLHPHFGAEALRESLAAAGIGYEHVAAMGGRRGRRAAGSPNDGWRVEAFNAFADHMATPEFVEALDALIRRAESSRTAILCSEALPWRCHRRLIADALVVRGWDVRDIIGPGKVEPHALTPFARVAGDRLTYPAAPLFTDAPDHP
jgi:uncharacterized protein (DUF488 family)